VNGAPLPRPLTDQLERFGRLGKDALNNANVYVNAPLHHFSPAETSLNILRNRSIRLTRASDLQDNFELRYGRECAESLLREFKRGAPFLVNSFCEVLLDRLEPAFEPFGFYVASFTASENGERLWNEYADQRKGFRISFTPEFFTHTKTPVEQLKPTEKMVLARTCYGAQKIEYRQRKIIERAIAVLNADAIKPHLGQRAYYTPFMRELTVQTATLLIFNALCAKQQSYDFEQETRLIIVGDADQLRPFEQLGPSKRPGTKNSRFIPISFEAWPKDISHLTVGAVALESSVEKMRTALGYAALSPSDQKQILR